MWSSCFRPVKLVLWSYATAQGWGFSLSFNIFNIGSFGIPSKFCFLSQRM